MRKMCCVVAVTAASLCVNLLGGFPIGDAGTAGQVNQTRQMAEDLAGGARLTAALRAQLTIFRQPPSVAVEDESQVPGLVYINTFAGAALAWPGSASNSEVPPSVNQGNSCESFQLAI